VRREGSRTLVVVGSAGERDPGKRAPLGAEAVRGADVAVLTEEDSRSEPVEAILAEMERGAESAGGVRGESYHLVPDRREAVALAYQLARPGDVVLLAGKGHERTLERAAEVLPWDEAALARELLPPGAR
jgi:UDP-N-acetylmuramoyl-L-alanyl-D-glutamate--2,6-diaminopimelate ligase